MGEVLKPFVVGVRFSKVGKVYHFSASDVADVKVGDMVVVETSRGWQLGTVTQVVQDPKPPPEGWKPIDRRATPRDLLLRQMWQMKESEVVASCRSRATDLRLNGIKIVSAEYSFDGSRLTILFSTETEEKYDLKSLRQDMQKMFSPTQVDMRQVGPRDVAKVHCGMGACGLETRCCCLFLTEFSSISIRMAKEQGISLTPSEITGMCGRLRCCLIYEYDTYVDARQKLPKRNKRVRTPQGEGKVVDIVPLRNAVIVEIPEVGHKEIPASEIILLDDNGTPSAEQPYYNAQQPSEEVQEIVRETTRGELILLTDDDKGKEKPSQKSDQERIPSEPRQHFQRKTGKGGQSPAQRGGQEPDLKKSNQPERQNQPGPGNRSGPSWQRKERRPGGQQQPPGITTNKPKGESGTGSQPRNIKDNRKRRGQGRNDNDKST